MSEIIESWVIPEEFSSVLLEFAYQAKSEQSQDTYPEYWESLSSITLNKDFSRKLKELLKKTFWISIALWNWVIPAPSYAYCGNVPIHKDTKDWISMPIIVINLWKGNGTLNIHNSSKLIIESTALNTGRVLEFNAWNFHSVTNANDLTILRCVLEK